MFDITELDMEQFNLYFKNCANKQEVVRMRGISAELGDPKWSSDVANEWWDPSSTVFWLVAMRAFESARAKGHT